MPEILSARIRTFRRCRSTTPPEAFATLSAEELHDAAAIAPQQAAGQYGGRVLLAGIEDDQQNYTRFLLISKSKKIGKGANKTSIGFALKNVPGVLFKALSVFALRDISLSKIESRPLRGHPWEYVFFVDILRGDDEAVAQCVASPGRDRRVCEGTGSLSGGELQSRVGRSIDCGCTMAVMAAQPTSGTSAVDITALGRRPMSSAVSRSAASVRRHQASPSRLSSGLHLL